MSFREEDRQKNSCPSRGLGIAAAAIGVGVGAALYYLFNKNQERPSSEGSSSGWSCDQQQTFHTSQSDTSYTTISENETSDCSMNSSSYSNISFTEENLVISVESISEENMSFTEDHSVISIESTSEENMSFARDNSVISVESTSEENMSFTGDNSVISVESTSEEDLGVDESDSSSESDSEISRSHEVSESSVTSVTDNSMSVTVNRDRAASSFDAEYEWEITTSSLGVPVQETSSSSISSIIIRIGNLVTPRNKMTEENRMAILRQQAFRERSWTLEECSICFDVMLRNQDVTSLPCAHNFHTDCIMPWLQEKQTCPNCRKAAE